MSKHITHDYFLAFLTHHTALPLSFTRLGCTWPDYTSSHNADDTFVLYSFPVSYTIYTVEPSKKLSKTLAFSLSALHQNIDDDGGAEQRGDGIQRDDATVRRKGAEKIAEEGNGCTHQHRDGQQTAMILRADDEAGDMRRCQADEGDGTAEGGNHSRKKTGDDEQNDAQTPDVETQILGILFA